MLTVEGEEGFFAHYSLPPNTLLSKIIISQIPVASSQENANPKQSVMSLTIPTVMSQLKAREIISINAVTFSPPSQTVPPASTWPPQ